MSKRVTMDVSDEEDDWNSESGEDDGDGPGREDEVEEVIQSTSAAGGSVKSSFQTGSSHQFFVLT